MSKELVNKIFDNDLDVDIYKDYLSKKTGNYLSYIDFYILLEHDIITIESFNRIKRLKKLKECFGDDLKI